MTLDTLVGFRGGKVDPAHLHAWVNVNLLETTTAEFTVDLGAIKNEPGQGLPAWVITHHNNGREFVWTHPVDTSGPLPSYFSSRESWAASQEDDNAYYAKWPKGMMAYVSFDTGYGYRGPMGTDCNDLHGMFIIRLIKEYADPRGLDVVWRNEYNGTWHEGSEGLDQFLEAGDAAQEWYQSLGITLSTLDI